MAESIACNNCGMVLDEDPEKRQPCPRCGSKARSSSRIFSAWSDVVTVRLPSTADLLLQTIIVPGEKIPEGQLIEAVALPWFELIELLEKDPSIVYQISDRTWEEIVAGAYSKAGFDEVILTPRSGNFGRDVITVKRGIGFVRVIDQVKAYKPGHPVDADDVRALMGVLQYDTASKGFLTTTSEFAPRIQDETTRLLQNRPLREQAAQASLH